MRAGFVGAVAVAIVVVVVALSRSGAAVSDRSSGPELGSLGACEAYDGLPAGFSTDPHAGMVRVRGGRFVVGSSKGYHEEKPAGEVEVSDFFIDRTEVTHAQFARFVAATGYVTLAERTGKAPVFDREGQASVAYAWWKLAAANRLDPDGKGARPRANEPVVQIALEDAFAYASWLGRDLPTEAEWEWAARAGRSDGALDRAPRDAAGKPLANFWQGPFPAQNKAEDGFEGRAPVGCFAANDFGLYDTIGNVWEWTSEPWFASHEDAQRATQRQRSGADAFVIKGGSFLCSSDFCTRYRASARHRQEVGQTGPHIGFRTVLRVSAHAQKSAN